ncbi:MAG: ribosome silencing factor [Cocleimonas sp.]|nr:ribosome silencing factor [Cocleimonas sp.]
MELKQLVTLCHNALDAMKAENIIILDVTDKSSMNDVMIFATGTSTRHVKALAVSINSDAKKAGVEPFGIEGANEGQWALVDLGDIVVHIMLPDVREFYQLERLWQDDDNRVVAESA